MLRPDDVHTRSLFSPEIIVVTEQKSVENNLKVIMDKMRNEGIIKKMVYMGVFNVDVDGITAIHQS